MLIQYLKKKQGISERNYKIIKGLIIATGMLSLSAGLILHRFFTGSPAVDFISGFFIGISIVANLLAVITVTPDLKR